MDFRLTPEAQEFYAEVCAFFDEHLDAETIAREERTGDGFDRAFHEALAERGWVAADWPKEFGGQERDAHEMYVLDQEFLRRGCPRNTSVTTGLVGNTLRVVGTERQKRELLPGIASGRIVISLGYSEPQAGSDVAAAQTRARREGDHWRIDGQKMFTTGAHLTDYIFLLARSDASGGKRDGLTMFLVPTDSEGFEAQAVPTLGGERTNLSFYSGVRVPDWLRVGEVGGGWDVMKVALSLEQGVGFSGSAETLHRRALEWAERAGRLDDPLVRERLARTALNAEVGKLLEQRAVWMTAEGRPMRAEGPMCKLFTSEALIEDAGSLLDMLGPDALESGGGPTSPAAAAVEFFQRYAQGTAIYAGTSEIMRSLIAEQGLGLPRSRSG